MVLVLDQALLLECEAHLKEEFILIPTDAYVDEKIENDWNKN